MLRLSGGQVESLWDEVLPVRVRELPTDLAALDELLGDPRLLEPIASSWQREAVSQGRPTISMESYVRLMVVKERTSWGYETLVREVSDSLHLRRFCLIALGERVPHESTVRKLTRRLGAEVVEELTRCVIAKACRETRFKARAVRIDSTVIEAEVRYPTDSGLALDCARVLASEARKLLAKVGKDTGHVRDRSRAIGRRVRLMSRTLGRRTGERKQQVLEFTEQAGKLVERSIREAKRLIVLAHRRARGRGAKAKLCQIQRLQTYIERAERVTEQIRRRMRGVPISDRLVSIFDPDARPIRKGKLGKPNEFGFVAQICEVTENTKRGARARLAGLDEARQSAGEHAAARHCRRVAATRVASAGSRARRRLRRGSDFAGPLTARSTAGIHRWAPAARVATDPAAARPLPHRRRGQNQPPQARLRATQIAVEGRGRGENVYGLVNPRLQP